jgi:hypothetical protein
LLSTKQKSLFAFNEAEKPFCFQQSRKAFLLSTKPKCLLAFTEWKRPFRFH